MAEEIHIYTITMARIYAAQGHHGKARHICRHLIAQNPEDAEALQVLAELDAGTATLSADQKPDLKERVKEWADLAGQYNRIRRRKKRA
jgi:hypothetical protein